MRRGLSFAELVVALAIIAVVTTVTLPSVGGLLDWIAVNTAAQDVATALAAARNAAVMQGSRTRLTIAPDTLRIDRWRGDSWDAVLRSEERRVGKGVDLGGRRIIKKKKTLP